MYLCTRISLCLGLVLASTAHAGLFRGHRSYIDQYPPQVNQYPSQYDQYAQYNPYDQYNNQYYTQYNPYAQYNPYNQYIQDSQRGGISGWMDRRLQGAWTSGSF